MAKQSKKSATPKPAAKAPARVSKARAPKSAARAEANDSAAPAFNTPAWHAAWKARGWEAPATPPPANPYDDQQLYFYAATLRSKFGFVRFVGLPTQGGPEDTPIQELFVEPALCPQRIDPASDPKQWPATTPLIEAVIAHPRMVALGDPGSGKSTLVSWIVYNLLSRERNPLKDALGALVPITLVLRDLELPAKPTWQDILAAFVKHPSGQALGSVERINQLLHEGHAIVLVDGLDEAGGFETRSHLAIVIHAAMRDWDRARFVVTSRVVGYDDAPIEFATLLHHPTGDPKVKAVAPRVRQLESGGLLFENVAYVLKDAAPEELEFMAKAQACTRLYVTPFDDARISLFVRNWHERHETDRSERNTRVSKLLQALERVPHVQALARVPNLLTLIAMVFRMRPELPDGRVEVYERITEAYLHTIELTRGLAGAGHPLVAMKRWLGYVAFQMQRLRFAKSGGDEKTDADGGKDNGILVSRDKLLEWISFAMQNGPGTRIAEADASAAAFVDWIARRAGLILPRSEDLFAFTHLSFQEYFAAWFLHEQVMDPGWLAGDGAAGPLAAGTDKKNLQAATIDIRWQETFILMFELLGGMGNWPNYVFKALFEGPLKGYAMPDGGELSYTDSHTQRECLMVAIALDRHGGLSEPVADAALGQAWRVASAGCLWRLQRYRHGAPKLIKLLLPANAPIAAPAWRVLQRPDIAQHVTALDLRHHASDQLLSRLAAKDSPLTGLTALILSDTEVTDEGVMALAAKDSPLTALTTLSLHYTEITDQGVLALVAKDSPFTALTTLYLGGTRVTDQGVQALVAKDSPFTGLTALYLHQTQITDQGVKALAAKDSRYTVLTTLSLGWTKVTDQGVMALAAKDSPLTTLTTLILSDTKTTDEGVMALAAKDSPLTALTELFLRNTKVTDRGIAALKQRFPKIKIHT